MESSSSSSSLSPLAVFLVKTGGSGNRVLFRYPFASHKKPDAKTSRAAGGTPARENGDVRPVRNQSSNSGSTVGRRPRNPYALPSSWIANDPFSGPSLVAPGSRGTSAMATAASAVTAPGASSGSAPVAGSGVSGGAGTGPAGGAAGPSSGGGGVMSSSCHSSGGATASSVSSHRTLNMDNLLDFPSKVLSNLFAVHPALCEDKFELKVDNIRFVGHPVSLETEVCASGGSDLAASSSSDGGAAGGGSAGASGGSGGESSSAGEGSKSNLTMFHIVFALKTSASYSVVQCFHELSKLTSRAIRSEEHRVGYFSEQARIIIKAQDDTASLPDDRRQVTPFQLALERSQLCRELKDVFDSISYTGEIYILINYYVEVNYCMTQKAYNRLNPCLSVDPESVHDCLEFLKPYHTLLMLQDSREFLRSLPIDSSPTLVRLVQAADPTLSFRSLALETDIPLRHILELSGHLLYWGKATVIYPVCENNLYVISPKISNVLTPVVMERFAEKFPGENFVLMLSLFSSPVSIGHHYFLHSQVSTQTLGMVIVFFLQQHLIVQIHTYITLCLNGEVTTRNLVDPIQKKYGLPWSVARHLGDESAARGTGGKRHVVEEESPVDVQADDLAKADDPAVACEEGLPKEVLHWAFPTQKSIQELAAAAAAAVTYPAASASSRDSMTSSIESLEGLTLEDRLMAFLGLRDSFRPDEQDQQPQQPASGTSLRQQKPAANPNDPKVILENFSEAERREVMRMPGAKSKADLKLFAKLAPFFNGRYHIEEILYFANIRRVDLCRILDFFRPLLVLHSHEDPSVTSFYDMSLRGK